MGLSRFPEKDVLAQAGVILLELEAASVVPAILRGSVPVAGRLWARQVNNNPIALVLGHLYFSLPARSRDIRNFGCAPVEWRRL
jgi:hypothetical protein